MFNILASTAKLMYKKNIYLSAGKSFFIKIAMIN